MSTPNDMSTQLDASTSDEIHMQPSTSTTNEAQHLPNNSTPKDMPPPATKGRTSKKNQPKVIAPDPNANRPVDYPNRWRIEWGKQTAKCMFCGWSQKGTKWCVMCNTCNRRMCSPCWEGNRLNKYGEEIFEGRLQNEEGCWCRFPSKFDSKYMPAVEERSARVRKLIQEEAQARKSEEAYAGSKDGGKVAELVVKPARSMTETMVKARIRERADASSEDDADMAEIVAKRQKIELDSFEHHLASTDDNNTVVYSDSDKGHDGTPPGRKQSPTVDSVHQMSLEVPRENNQRIKHLHNKTTVIIGAGVIGLAIARELAAATSPHTKHTVIVVEKRRTYAEEASAHCAGLITRHSVPEEYERLLHLSLSSWRDLLDDETCAALHYNPDGVVHVREKSKEKEEDSATIEAPAWYNLRPEDTLERYGSDVGKISTSSFLHYLYRECDELGVRFRFDQEVINIEKTKQAKITSVDIARVGNHDRVVEVPCHNIIVAAGSHSLDALHEIVPWIEPRTTLVNDQQYCDWVSFKGPTISNLNQVGLVVHNTTGTDPVIVAAQAPKQLLVATVRPFDNADPKTTKEPTSDAFLIAKGRFGGLIDSAKMSEGRTIVSTAMDELPHVCRIPSYFIDDRFSDFENESTLGIYLAYGFGMYGTTLSLGVAVALRRMLAGGDAGIGDEFGYPMMDGDDAESGNEPQFLPPPLLYRFV